MLDCLVGDSYDFLTHDRAEAAADKTEIHDTDSYLAAIDGADSSTDGVVCTCCVLGNLHPIRILFGIAELEEVYTGEIGISFNYHKRFTEEEGTNELIAHLLEKHIPIMLDADKVTKCLFGEPVDGGKKG